MPRRAVAVEVRPPARGCRVIAVSGDVTAGGAAVSADSAVPEEAWIVLLPAAKLVAKDVRTTRETNLLGPAQARACVDGREESWVASGAFESSVGAGEMPGAEEWVVTPAAVLRYAAAKVRIDVRPRETTVAVAGGVAFAWLPEGSRWSPSADATAAPSGDDGDWKRVAGGVRATIGTGSARLPADAARSALDQCEPLARRSRDLAVALLAGDAGGDVAAAQVETRRLARAACAVAALRAKALSTAEAPGLSARVADAVAMWSTLPGVPSRP